MVVHHFLSSLSEAVLSVSSLDLLCGLTTVRFYSGVKWLCIRLIAFSYDRKNPLADKSRGVGAREPICCCYGYLLQSIKNCCTGFDTKNIFMQHFCLKSAETSTTEIHLQVTFNGENNGLFTILLLASYPSNKSEALI